MAMNDEKQIEALRAFVAAEVIVPSNPHWTEYRGATCAYVKVLRARHRAYELAHAKRTAQGVISRYLALLDAE